MPSFQYRAYGAVGELVDGLIEAASIEAAENLLSLSGLTPFRMKQVSDQTIPWWRREVFATAGASQASLAAFTREFAELCASGIPLDDCLRILSDQAASDKMRAIAKSLVTGLLDGAALAEAMRKHAGVFPPDYLNIVQAGEMSGTLGQALEELAELMERRAAVEARIKSALTYPAILVGMAFLSIGIVLGVLVPSITPIFEQNGKAPPAALRVLIMLRENGALFLLVAAGLVLLLAAVAIFVHRSPERRLSYDRIKLRLVVIRQFILDGDTARFARTLGTLLKAGVPLLQAAIAARGVVKNRYISARVERAIALLREGTSLSNALRSEGIFPEVALRMISVGEEAAKLDRMLLRTALMFENQGQRRIDALVAVLTPALTVLIAAMVGGLILTVMNTILSVNELAAG